MRNCCMFRKLKFDLNYIRKKYIKIARNNLIKNEIEKFLFISNV